MKIKASRILTFCVVMILVFSLNCEPVVKIGRSQIFGETVDFKNFKVNQYLGIPYAKPPVGELRFMPTVPIGQQPRIWNAFHEPPACPQYTENPYPWYVNSSDKSEDCLFLNIWTPSDASPKNRKAVMYWIHGGGYRYGSIRSKIYNGIALSALGDIIVVTANYRLGPLGFLVSGTDDAPGNAGLWDNLEGLRWVNKNIKYFGGDPAKITLAGESSGSLSVGLLSISPLAKGLYKRQIMESGAPTFWNAETLKSTNIAFAQQLAKMVNCANDSFTIQNNPKPVVGCLKRVDSMVLSRADSHILNISTFDFMPIYGDEIIPENPRTAVLRKNFHCTDLLIGNNQDEGSFLITTGNTQLFGFFGQKNTQINKTTGADIIRALNQGFPDLEGLIKYYLPDDLEDNDSDHIRRQTYTACGDPLFVCTDIYYSEKCAEEGNNVYFYVWRHRPSTTVWAPWMGVAHYTEVQFVFGQPLLNPSRYETSETKLSVEMIKIWSNFVKTGKPGIPWPKYSQKPDFKYIGPGVNLEADGTGFHRDNCNFLRPSFGFQNT